MLFMMVVRQYKNGNLKTGTCTEGKRLMRGAIERMIRTSFPFRSLQDPVSKGWVSKWPWIKGVAYYFHDALF